MMDIQAIFNSITPLSSAGLDTLLSISEEINVPKNTLIIVPGKIERNLFFIKSGLARIYYETASKEITVSFSEKGSILYSLNSYTSGKAGKEYIQVIEDSVLVKIDQVKLQKYYQENLELANWGRKLTELEFIKSEERLVAQFFKTAKERYEDLLRDIPDLPNRTKLAYIASYLGINQVTLSRIRSI
ncbi:Crp/Fnr family transcriptional regulator [Sphingobacterium hungaricum]|uniref:Crp/Fnr family transcriptional regulator n=1 Tax=Sphingobacterium hungaricum TaxID=2082723 RepID=A0A928UWA5_9SPHI|nr:Crp/Fnr family transcriptional regulator [Sphingobacterium hungaricum]MBE8713872.1 Crp/Fnr family transcriptional regulator [Sphingobacterium hungaricum]